MVENSAKASDALNSIDIEQLDSVSGGAKADKNGNFICPRCREYAMKLGDDGQYHCSFCGYTSQNPF